MNTKDPSERLKAILDQAAPAAPAKKRTPPKGQIKPVDGVIYVAGDGNVVAGGNLTQTITHIHEKPARPKVVVKTADGVIDASQKAELLRLKNDWVLAHNAIKKNVLSHQSAWAKLNKAMKVNSYAEIKSEQFEKAKAWLQKQSAIIRSKPSAAAKEGDKWRNARYAAIKARCKNQLGDEFAYKNYIKRNFNADSLTELGTAPLDQTYRYIMNKNLR
jgi:hypothetical protein